MEAEELYRKLKKIDGISNNVIKAMKLAPREKFVPQNLQTSAYENTPLPIGFGQTISQPSMVGIMIDLLNLTGDEKVLEIGTGSGWVAAILSNLAKEVYTIERIKGLYETAKSKIESMGYRNVKVLWGDGTLGYPDKAPYDRIIVSAGAPHIPTSLLQQLKSPGRMVIPVGDRKSLQKLLVIDKSANGDITQKENLLCSFVPLIGKYGWKE